MTQAQTRFIDISDVVDLHNKQVKIYLFVNALMLRIYSDSINTILEAQEKYKMKFCTCHVSSYGEDAIVIHKFHFTNEDKIES